MRESERESEEKGAPGGGRFDLLLKQLGAGVVAESLGVEVSEGGEGEGGGSIRQSPVRSTLKTRWDRSMGWVRSFPSSPFGLPPGWPSSGWTSPGGRSRRRPPGPAREPASRRRSRWTSLPCGRGRPGPRPAGR